MGPMQCDCYVHIHYNSNNRYKRNSPLYPRLNPQHNQKQLKGFIEKTSPKRETPGKGLITAALRPHKRETSRPRARNREKTYKIYPTKGINQIFPTFPTISFLLLQVCRD